MNRTLTMTAGIIVCAGLTACVAPRDPQELSQKTVQYRCGANSEAPMAVQYTFQGRDPMTAKIMYNNQAVDLPRVTGSNADLVGNTFRGGGYTWTTDKFDVDSVANVNGNMLTQDVQQTVNGQPTAVSNILLNFCKVIPQTQG